MYTTRQDGTTKPRIRIGLEGRRTELPGPLFDSEFECQLPPFVETLKEQLGDAGTILIWSKHERTALKEIAEQMVRYGYRSQALESWIDEVTRPKNGPSPRLLDLCEVTKNHYFHPKMKGKLSLKAVLPAIWESNPGLHRDPAFSQYFRRDTAGCVVDPYLTLLPLSFGNNAGEDDEVVSEGSGATRVSGDALRTRQV
jgi:hypothetical protein